MSTRSTRVLLIRNLLRAADRRQLARVLDRISAADLDALFSACSPLELRRGASVLLDACRIDTTAHEHGDAGLRLLLVHARPDDARRLLAALTPSRAGAVLLEMPAEVRAELLRAADADVRAAILGALRRYAHPGRVSLLSVLRLRRLFA